MKKNKTSGSSFSRRPSIRQVSVGQTHYGLAKTFQEQGEWEKALTEYQTALNLEPHRAEIYQGLGDVFVGLGQWQEATDAYQKALDLNPNLDSVNHNLGDVLLKLERYEDAVSAYQKAIALNPNFSWSYNNLGDALRELQRWDEAAQAYQNAIKLKSDFALSHHNLGYVLVKKEKLEDAIAAYKKAIELDPNFVWSYYNLAGSFEQLGHWDEAVEAYRQALKIQPDLPDVEEKLNQALHQQVKGKLDQALSYYRQAIENDPTDIESYQKALEIKPDDAELYLGLRNAWYQRGEYQKALDIYQKLLYIQPDLVEVVSPLIQNLKSAEKDSFRAHSINHEVIYNPSSLIGNIDLVNHMQIEGWVADPNFPQNSLELDVYINGLKYESIIANLPRNDVKELFKIEKPGFFVRLPAENWRGAEVVLTLKNSYLPILNTPIIILSKEAKINLISLLNKNILELNFLTVGEKRWLMKALFPNLKRILRNYQGDENEKDVFNIQCHHLSWWKARKQLPTNVIVPVYKNLKVTQECLERLITSKRNYPYKITIINDCSPEPEIHSYLDRLAQSGQITLINHVNNEGFVKSVNNGMKSDTQLDVVLLNSDAYVTDYWLDYLRDAVYQEERIATGTPLSNNATIFSYPINCQETENLPNDLTLEELGEICQRVNQDIVIDVPTGHGFCLYIRRDALIEVGDFDAETWGRGYGEEVDWCQRALDLGWRHIAVPGVFVQHVGSQSFTDDKTSLINRSARLLSEKYPEYNLVIQEFIKSDPLAIARRNIDLERLKRREDRFILMISHNLGGGTERHIKDLVSLLERENINSLVLKPNSKSNDWLELTFPKLDLLARYNLVTDSQSLIKDLKDLGVFHVHIHHTIGFPNNFIENLLEGLALSYDITLHDYASICPRVTLSQNEGKYCQEPPVKKCELCIKKHGVHESLQKIYKEIDSIEKWRINSKRLLQPARKIFVPSQDMAKRMSKYFPEIEFTLRSHPDVKKTVILHSQNDYKSTIRVGLIGGISEIKGLNTLYECAKYAAKFQKDIEFIVIGQTANNSLFEELSNVTISGAYERKELNYLISQSKLDFVAFFTTVPETYCYTLSEALENGLYPFAFDIGAVSERVRQLGVGYLIDHNTNVAFLVEALYNFGVQCREQQRTIDISNDYADSFLNDYYSLKS